MKTAFVFLALLTMSVASVANKRGCCKKALETFERKVKNLIAEFKKTCEYKPQLPPGSKYSHVGCFKDKPNRAMPKLLGSWRFDSEAIQKCMRAAEKAGYAAFGVQWSGQCWSGPLAHMTYSKYGTSSRCKNGIGGSWAQNVYILIASSCKELHDKNPSLKSGVQTLLFGQQKVPVYCHMGNFGCGNGGWTPVMKIDGKKATFVFDSSFWSNKDAFNLMGGKTGFDKAETKLPSYWTTPFSKICLGMMIGNQVNFVVIDKQASSLYSLIADGKYRATSLGRKTWKKLIGSAASLQYNCNKEGFNPVPTTWRRVRIGFVANNEYHCNNCDSFIGFGSVMPKLTCGNCAAHGPTDNGYRNIRAMGYILVQ